MQKQRELWKSGIKAHKEAKKLALEFVEETFDALIENALATNSDFTYEGHFMYGPTCRVISGPELLPESLE
jgi:hypothetical protein